MIIMYKFVKRFCSFALALLMALSLVACGDSNDNKKTPEDDVPGYLLAAIENTYNQVSERYDGSPLAAILNTLDNSGKFSVSGEIDGGYPAVDLDDLTLEYDLDEKTFLLSLDMTSNDITLSGNACVSPDFIGVSCPILLGDDAYYGIMPRDLASQLKDSVLWDLADSDVGDADLAQLDSFLDSLWNIQIMNDSLTTDMKEVFTDYFMNMDFEYEKASVKVNGKDADGYVFSTTVTSDDLIDLMNDIFDVVLDMPVWDTVLEISNMSGEGITKEQFWAMMEDSFEESLGEMSGADLDMNITFYVANETVVRTESTAHNGDDSMNIVIDYFDDNGVTAKVDSDGQEIIFSSIVETGKKNYTHKLSLTSQGDTRVIREKWDDDKFTFEVESPDDISFVFSSNLSVTKTGFTLEGFSFESSSSMGDVVDIPLTVEYVAGGTVTAPKNTKNVLTLSDEELIDLFSTLEELVGE